MWLIYTKHSGSFLNVASLPAVNAPATLSPSFHVLF